ncbi:uncharacterized protein LOC142629244 [Castanea sativa]|uniref:uncharacterized protein LOC142629244 n=1 Tax=Castanea sativa TaxID=21020 RepID=UPI003F64937B
MLRVEEFNIHRVLMDNGSSANIIYLPAFQKMKLDNKKITPFTSPLVSFTGDMIVPRSIVTLTVILGTYPAQVTKKIDFLIFDCPSTYNIILGRPALKRLRAVTSTYYLKVKFPTAHGVGEIKGDQVLARECNQATLAFGENQTWVINEPEPIPEPSKTPQEVEIVLGGPTKILKIGTAFLATKKEKMQKRRVFAPERKKAVTEEVEKLLEANFIREVFYLDWLANVVMVKKSNGKWRMCVNFTDLNKACPKDSFPLPMID